MSGEVNHAHLKEKLSVSSDISSGLFSFVQHTNASSTTFKVQSGTLKPSSVNNTNNTFHLNTLQHISMFEIQMFLDAGYFI